MEFLNEIQKIQVASIDNMENIMGNEVTINRTYMYRGINNPCVSNHVESL